MKNKIFIECTHTFHCEINTGIQRVVRNILRHAPDAGKELSFEIYPVIYDEGRFVRIETLKVFEDKRTIGDSKSIKRKLLSLYHLGVETLARLLPFHFIKRFLFAPKFQFGLSWCIYQPIKLIRSIVSSRADNIQVSKGDILLLLDSSWVLPIWDAVRKFKKDGGKVAGVIYDIIPITHVETVADPFDKRFQRWIKEHSVHTDYYYTISQTVARELESYLGTINIERPFIVKHFYLGTELDFKNNVQIIDQGLKNVFECCEQIYLVVGSIEPRKNHSYILNAFDNYWMNGGTAKLVIIGSSGWNNDATLERIHSHSSFAKKLFLLRNLSDAELDYCYKNSTALIIASLVEGFGLPIVEAFNRGLPVLCSDIPVFREIAEDHAQYFDLCNYLSLTHLISTFSGRNRFEPINSSKIIPWLDWYESTNSLFRLIKNDMSSEKNHRKV